MRHRWTRVAAVAVAGALALPAAAAMARATTPARAAGPALAPVPSGVAFILLDTNSSPTTARLRVERQQALTYARALPADVAVGLIVFASTWHTALRPTTSRPALVTALAAVTPASGTSTGISQALTGAMAVIGKLGAIASARVLVLSNAESLSHPVPAPAIRVDVVTSYYDNDDYPATLKRLAEVSGGRNVSPAGLAALAAGEFPPPPASPSAAPATSPRASTAAPAWRLSGGLAGVLAIVFVAFFVLALLGISSTRRGDRRTQLVGQIEHYGPMSTSVAPVASEGETEGKVARRAVDLMAQVLRSRQSEPRLALRLDRAGIGRQPAEWALLCVCACVVLAAGCSVLLSNVALGVLVGVVLGWAGMRLILSAKISRRRAAFDDQLPGILQLVASSIQSGFSLAQAFDAVVREDAQPASGEFARALAETRLGVDLADALDGVADRLQSADLGWVIMAIRIQRETGGNLAEVLRNTVATMRERAYLRRQVRTLSAEGRLSAYILLALPVLVGGWLFYSDPVYMRPLYTTFVGIAMLIVASVLIVVGGFWMRNLINVEV